MRWLAGLPLLLLTMPALAHGLGTLDEDWIGSPLLLALVLYVLGLLRLWRRAGLNRGVPVWQAACFVSGIGFLLLVIASPWHALAQGLFFAHMLEHELLMLLAAPLLVLGRPLGVYAWSLPATWRRPGYRLLRGRRRLLPVWHALSRPALATGLHAAAIWIWHVPVLFQAALLHPVLHALQHLSFLLTALLFWAVLFRRGTHRHPATAMLYLFITALHTSALGALLTLSQRLWYPHASGFAGRWHLSLLEDQQLAGLIMWIPGGVLYTLIALIIFGFWLNRQPAPAAWEQRHAWSGG